jgi:hypothetical protein
MKVLMESWRKYLKEAEEFVPKIDNRGDVAEGLLGAALVARYLKSAEEDSNVTEKDIENVLDQLNGTDAIPIMKKDGSEATGKVRKVWKSSPLEREDGTKDEVEFTVALNQGPFSSLVNPAQRIRLQGGKTPDKPGDKPQKQPNLYAAVAKYANSANVIETVADEMFDEVPSLVRIVSDGVSDQKGTKVDLLVYKDDKKLKRIGSLSLKALGTKQMGQIGKGWKNLKGEGGSRGIYDLMKALFGIELPDSLAATYSESMKPGRTKEETAKGVKTVFEEAAKLAGQKFAADAANEDMEFKKGLARAIRYEAALEDEEVYLVHLNDGDYKELDFSIIEDKLGEIDIEVSGKFTGAIPYIYVMDTTNNLKLLQIRPKIRASEVKIYVEKEKGLVKLLDIANAGKRPKGFTKA